MRTSRLGPRDVTATLIVAAATVIYGLTRSGVEIAGMGSTRVLAAVVLGLGLLACAVGARSDAFAGEMGVPAAPPITRALSVLGGGALFIGIAAVVTASDALLTTLVVLTLVLWLAATVRHLAVPLAQPSPAPSLLERSLLEQPLPEQSLFAQPPAEPAPPEPTTVDRKPHAHIGGDQR